MDNQDNDDLLFTNAFMSPLSAVDLSDVQKSQFRDYYLQTKQREERDYRLGIVSGTAPGVSDQQQQQQGLGEAAGSGATYNYTKTSIVNIDTRDRDIVAYPNQNHFKAFLGHHFQNVQKIQLVSSEFTNTDQIVRGSDSTTQNNIITWCNEEDKIAGIACFPTISTQVTGYVDVNFNAFHYLPVGTTVEIHISGSGITGLDGYRMVDVLDTSHFRFPWPTNVPSSPATQVSVDIAYPTYSVQITPGNYSIDSLATELQTELNLVKRQQGQGIYHYFLVTADSDTDILTFQSFILTQLIGTQDVPQPLSCTSGSTTISVYQQLHGFATGESVLISGIASNFGGIPFSTLNGIYPITVVDSNNFTYDVNVKASSTVVHGGGTNIVTGTPAPFRFLFQSFGNTIQDILGFPYEDSSDAIGTTSSLGPVTTHTYAISGAVINGDAITITTSTSHILQSSNKFTISSIAPGSYQGANGILVTTSVAHGLTETSIVYIQGSNSVPSIDGSISAVPTDVDILFWATNTISLTANGTAGTLRWGGDMVRLSGLSTLPNIEMAYPIDNASGSSFDFPFSVTYIDSSSIPNATVQTGLLTINHPNHGFNIITNSKFVTSLPAPYTLDSARLYCWKVTTQVPYTTQIIPTTVQVTTDGSNHVTLIFPSAHGFIARASQCGIVISSSANIPNGYDLTGMWNIYQVPNVDTLIIFVLSSLPSSTGGTAVVSMTSPQVVISQTNNSGGGSFDGIYPSMLPDTSTTFYVGNFNPQDGTDGTFGLFGARRNNLALYRVVSDLPSSSDNNNTLAGIPLTSINGVYRDIVTLIDSDNYTIRIPDQYATYTVTAGGTDVRVSSEVHGMSRLQANTSDGTATGVLYKTPDLSGENYVFLVCPGLQSTYNVQTIYNASGIADVFAKILLSGPPGYVLFNTFLSQPIVFDFPVPVLSQLEFYVYKHDGNLFDFHSIDFSFSLEVTEILNSHTEFNVSSRTGEAVRARGTGGMAVSGIRSAPLIQSSGGPGTLPRRTNTRGLPVISRS